MFRKRSKPIGCTLSEQHSLAAAEVIAGNIDLLTEILLLIPAKSLIRFKCVSKHWLFLISDSQFALNHATQNPRALISGLYFDINHPLKKVESVALDGNSSIPTLDFLNDAGDGSKIAIKHSCNGLLLCMNRTKQLIVCNPTTQKYAVIPQISSGAPAFGRCLAFDPSKSPHYKVVLVSYLFNSDYIYEIDIYCSNSGSWKHLQVSEPQIPSHEDALLPLRSSFFTHWAFWNGSIHWMSPQSTIHNRFDVDAETLTTQVPTIPKVLPHNEICYFGESGGGRLILIQSCRRSSTDLVILEMDEDCCHWNVMYRVNLGPLIPVFPDVVRSTKSDSILCVLKDSNEKHNALELAIGGKAVFYDMKRRTKTVKEVRIFHPDDLELYFYRHKYAFFHRFIDSLYPV